MSWPSPADRFQNPFSTRCVRPGAAPYLFSFGEGAAELVARLERNGWRGQIVGPHGSGKSSLLAALQGPLEARGRRVLLVALHDGERRLPVDLRREPGLGETTLIIVDGYEQLGLWNRWRLARLCRRRKWGLLVTSHRPVQLPIVTRTSTSPELAQQIVDRLLPVESPILRSDVAERFTAHHGNLREMLFDLYDLYESRRPSAQADKAG